MHTVTVPLLTMFLGAVTAILVLVGAVVFFTLGRARGVLAGVGFVVLALGVAVGTMLAVVVPMISAGTGTSPTTAAIANSVVQIVVNLVGWGLVIAAMLRLRAERTHRPAPPEAGPGWGHPASGTQGPPPPGV